MRTISSGSRAARQIGNASTPASGLEEDRLALHHRQRGLRTDIAETQHGRAVGDDRDEIALGGQLVTCDGSSRMTWAGDKRRRRHIERVQDVVIANRDLAADFEHAAVALAKVDRLFAERLVLTACGRLRRLQTALVDEAARFSATVPARHRVRPRRPRARRARPPPRSPGRPGSRRSAARCCRRAARPANHVGQRVRGVEHHPQADIAGAGIEQTAEEAREDERDIHHVREVGAAGGDDLGAAGAGGCRVRFPGPARPARRRSGPAPSPGPCRR